MYKIENLTKKFKGRTILNDITISFDDIGLYFLQGYNGAGKTTLLNILAALDNNYDGYIYLNDKLLKKMSSKDKCNLRKNEIEYILPKNNLLSFYNLKENLELNNKIDNYTLINNIDLNKNINEISGGQEILLALTKALNSNKKIILLDEVSAQLDESNTKKLLNLLINLSKEKLIIFSTHDSRLTKTHFGKSYTIKEGKIYD